MAVRADDVDLLRDRALVERFQSGDVDGFDDLYRRYFGRLHRFCMKRLDGDAHEAEEVVQEAFVRALRAMPQLDGERRFYPWLTVIASRLCVDAHRRRGRSVPAPEIDLGVIDGGQEDVVDAVDSELITAAMSRLSERHREVLELREHHGWSYQRIAEHYDVTQGTIEALLFRARRALRREFLGLSEVGGRLAGLPVIGWVIRRMHAAHDRVALWAGQGVGQVMAAAIPLVVATTAVGMGVGGGSNAPDAVRLAARTPVELHAPQLVAVPAGAAVVDASELARPVTVAPSVPVERPAPDAVVENWTTTSADGSRRVDNHDVSADTPVARIGVNVEKITEDLGGSVVSATRGTR